MSFSLSYYRKSASLLLKDLQSDELSVREQAAHRLMALRIFSALSLEELLADLTQVKRKHALLVVAKEAGFDSWLALKQQVDFEEAQQEQEEPDWKEFFGSPRFGMFLNHWFRSYEEAKDYLKREGGYLFPYRHQSLVAGEGFVRQAGLDPQDPDWERIGFDWAKPDCPHAWHRLKTKLVEAVKQRS